MKTLGEVVPREMSAFFLTRPDREVDERMPATILNNPHKPFQGTGAIYVDGDLNVNIQTTGPVFVNGSIKARIQTKGPIFCRKNVTAKAEIRNDCGGYIYGSHHGKWFTKGSVIISRENKGVIRTSAHVSPAKDLNKTELPELPSLIEELPSKTTEPPAQKRNPVWAIYKLFAKSAESRGPDQNKSNGKFDLLEAQLKQVSHIFDSWQDKLPIEIQRLHKEIKATQENISNARKELEDDDLDYSQAVKIKRMINRSDNVPRHAHETLNLFKRGVLEYSTLRVVKAKLHDINQEFSAELQAISDRRNAELATRVTATAELVTS